MKTFFITAILTLATLANAQKIVPLTFSINATAMVQNYKTTTNGGNISIAAPTQYTVTTASILRQLAIDEFNLGNYSATNFPTGAKLVWMDYPDNFEASYFAVVGTNGAVICDVSDLIGYTKNAAEFAVNAGTVSPYYKNLTETYVGAILFDDTNSGGSTRLYIGGLVKAVGNQTPMTGGGYKEAWTATVTGAVGNGRFGGKNLFITGTFSATGSAKF